MTRPTRCGKSASTTSSSEEPASTRLYVLRTKIAAVLFDFYEITVSNARDGAPTTPWERATEDDRNYYMDAAGEVLAFLVDGGWIDETSR